MRGDITNRSQVLFGGDLFEEGVSRGEGTAFGWEGDRKALPLSLPSKVAEGR